MKTKVLVFLFLLSGCSFVSKTLMQEPEIDRFENQKIIVQTLKKDFIQGKKLFFIEPFQIGEETEASLTTDHIAQTLQFGVEEGLRKEQQLMVHDRAYAEIWVRGVVEKFQKPSLWKRHLFFLKKESELMVLVFFIDAEEGTPIAFALGWSQMPYQSEDIENQSYQMGKDMAREILFENLERDL